MAKYSTGGVGGDSGGACELCGAEDRSLETATVAGAELQVCSECARHGDDGGSSGSGGATSGGDGREETNRRKKAAQNMAKLDDAQKVNSDWQEDTEYEEDPLPYLVRGYGDRAEQARQDAGLQTDELAEELGVDEEDIVAVEQGRAARAGVGGSLIEALEDELGIELADE
ncbi:transcriptional regulator [Natronomonas sp.]|uniref:transcriptional regulator n=1 Tax=Natronomonas sp. TaxID=2184060 RepID=UPI002FC3355B